MKKNAESQVILFENFFNQNVGNDFFQLQHRFCHVCDFQIGFLNLYFNKKFTSNACTFETITEIIININNFGTIS